MKNIKFPDFATLAALHTGRKDLWVAIEDSLSGEAFDIRCHGCGYESYKSLADNAHADAQEHALKCTGLGIPA